MIYVEFRIRRPGIDLEIFHQLVARRKDGWSERFNEDQMILNLGRTWRIGPHPEYLAVYHTPSGSLERFSQWEEIFRSGAVADLEAQTRAVSPIVDAGCYLELATPASGSGGPYYAEYFDFQAGASRGTVRAFYEDRRGRHDSLTLHLLCDRMGKLGPGPRGLAIWSAASYGGFADLVCELEDDTQAPVQVVMAGFYADTGTEVL